MRTVRFKRLLAFLLCMCVWSSLCGCSILDEQWEVVEQYREETATTQEKEEEATTTQELPEQNVLADFLDSDADTLGGRIAVPNGYERVGATTQDSQQTTEEKSDSASKTKSDAQTTDADSTSEKKGSDETTTESAAGTTQRGTTTESAAGTTQRGTTTESAAGTTQQGTTTEQSTTQERRNDTGKTYTIAEFMRSLPVKEQTDKVLLYNGEEKKTQDSCAAVLQLTLDQKNLQQRASSIMRLYAEYEWMNQNYDDMQYQLNNGFVMDYGKWIDGYRVTVQNQTASWYNYGSAGDNYETFLAYLEYYFCYSGMSSMLAQSHTADVQQIAVGDYFTDEKQENAAMVVDVAEDADGQRCFLLAAGGSPGQDIEILRNPAHEDPWYYVSELEDTFSTPEFSLSKSECYHLTTKDSPATASGDADQKASTKADKADKNVSGEADTGE